MSREYLPRIADRLLALKLEGKGAVVVEGAKWCGKTRTAEQQARSKYFMSEHGRTAQNIQLARMNPQFLLRGAKPRLIDEWQVAPTLWDSIRHEADQSDDFGLFILTGSAVPPDMSQVFHSGTGRFGWVRMRPMALWESRDSSGEVSLRDLFDQRGPVGGVSAIDLPRLAFLTCRGGWPATVSMRPEVALEQAFDYVDAVEKHDLRNADGIKRDPAMVHRILRCYARHQGAQASYGTIRADLANNEGNSLSEDTISLYLRALKNIFVIEDAEAWNPNLRSRTAVRSSDTRYFSDPSIATAALGLGPGDLMTDLNTFGMMFETLAVRDLRVYAEAVNGKVYHYRDKNGLECDAVVHLRNGRYGLVEIKLGGDDLVDHGAMTLLALAEKIDTSRMAPPSFMMVLTGVGEFAYQRDDGVLVVPVGCLKD